MFIVQVIEYDPNVATAFLKLISKTAAFCFMSDSQAHATTSVLGPCIFPIKGHNLLGRQLTVPGLWTPNTHTVSTSISISISQVSGSISPIRLDGTHLRAVPDLLHRNSLARPDPSRKPLEEIFTSTAPWSSIRGRARVLPPFIQPEAILPLFLFPLSGVRFSGERLSY